VANGAEETLCPKSMGEKDSTTTKEREKGLEFAGSDKEGGKLGGVEGVMQGADHGF